MSIVQEKQSHVFPGIGLGALGGLVIQGFRIDTVDKKTVCASVLLGGILGGVIGKLFDLSEESKPDVDNKKRRKKELENKQKIIAGKGIVCVHCADESNSSVNYEDIVRRDLVFTDGFKYDTVIKALEFAQKTKSIQNVFKLFDDKKNALIFVENDFTNGNLNATISSRLKNDKYIEYDISENLNILQQRSELSMQKYFYAVIIDLYPKNSWSKIVGKEFIKYTDDERIASLLVIIGHELFIHNSHIEALKLWKSRKYQDSISKSINGDGDKDHQQYVLKKKTAMNDYLNELKELASKDELGVSYIEIVKAIKRHDDNYR
ncbi:MAG: hypothetical protein IIU11_00545 [Bacteroidales bacterium]|nr:hypothetical protein [Bacteroidales bacterium]